MTKDLFIKTKELRDQWAAWAKKPEFETILVYAKASFAETHRCNPDALAGALSFADHLLSLGDEEAQPQAPVVSGFHHLPDKV